jgi:hypothetical protein
MPRRAWESRPGTAPSTPPARPSLPLCDAVQYGQQQPRGTVPPTPVRPTRRTLEKGRRSPRREDERLLHACTGLRRDVRASGGGHLRRHWPCATIPTIATPSWPLHHHPRRCGSVRREDTATLATVPRTASRQRHPRVLTRMAIKQATSTPPPSKPLLDVRRTHYDAPP